MGHVPTLLQFTFHYVSISTTLNPDKVNITDDLHSTMYLFQLINLLSLIFFKNIYIPLCIYFNAPCAAFAWAHLHLHSTMYLFQPINQERIDIQDSFTFHYVSISTMTAVWIARTVINLHSTMYLFQRGKCRKTRGCIS